MSFQPKLTDESTWVNGHGQGQKKNCPMPKPSGAITPKKTP